MHPMLHDAITALLVHIQIGSLVWMFVYSRGSLSSVYASVRPETYEADPLQQFIDAHVSPDPGGPGVTNRAMFEAFNAWCEANGIAKMYERRFGVMMKRCIPRDDSMRVHVYRNVALRDRTEPALVRSHGVAAFARSALVTLLLILGWPAMLIALYKGALR